MFRAVFDPYEMVPRPTTMAAIRKAQERVARLWKVGRFEEIEDKEGP